jgi:hypothetical protein
VDLSDPRGKFEPNILLQNGKVYKNIEMSETGKVDIEDMTRLKETCQAPRPIIQSYVERQNATSLYCLVDNYDLYAYSESKFHKIGVSL